MYNSYKFVKNYKIKINKLQIFTAMQIKMDSSTSKISKYCTQAIFQIQNIILTIYN